MYKLVTIYRVVDDADMLEQFFSRTHLPLAEQLPGLLEVEVSRIHGKPGGKSRFHLMIECYFESAASYEAAMTSEIGLELLGELKEWYEAKILTWFEAESFLSE